MNLESWFRDLGDRRSAKLPRPVRVEGLCRRHLGPRLEFGRIVVEAAPGPRFAVTGPAAPLPVDGEGFLQAAVFGILDVVLTAEPFPLKDFTLHVVEFESHPIDSNLMAFRNAGRDAGRKLLQEAGLAPK
jgi:hypothetical protein